MSLGTFGLYFSVHMTEVAPIICFLGKGGLVVGLRPLEDAPAGPELLLLSSVRDKILILMRENVSNELCIMREFIRCRSNYHAHTELNVLRF